VLVRTDIPLAQQVVQVGHACLEAGRRFDWPEELCNLVVLGVATQHDLQINVERARLAGIRIAVFDEPDDGLGITAACTEPLTGSIKRVFRRLPLWCEQVTSAAPRGPPTRAMPKDIRALYYFSASSVGLVFHLARRFRTHLKIQ